MSPSQVITNYLKKVKLPKPDSHKGQNGKLLIIGGSQLFHAASKWSLDIASKFVDMVFYSSVPDNNELIKQAKGEFWNGIVVPRDQVEDYIKEADCILIGPGMERQPATAQITNNLLKNYPDKKWVVDAGALQEVEPDLLNEHCVITPHEKELGRLLAKTGEDEYEQQLDFVLKRGTTIVLKGQVDQIMNGDQVIEVPGGNAGMTKGGTGDVLAGLLAALFCQHDALTSSIVASYVNKTAGDSLYSSVGPFFNASDLVEEVPKVLWNLIESS